MNPTALDILNKHLLEAKVEHPVADWIHVTNGSLAAMREIAEMSFEAGKQRGIAEEVEDTCGFIQDQPDKEEFIKQLFPEK